MAGVSFFSVDTFLVGLAADVRRRGGGLLLGGITGRFEDPLVGLDSKAGPFIGVVPRSAYFQNGAGELVGMTWLGR